MVGFRPNLTYVMSSRALRKLQKEQEAKIQFDKMEGSRDELADDSDNEEVKTAFRGTAKLNLFGMLNAGDADAEDEEASAHSSQENGMPRSGSNDSTPLASTKSHDQPKTKKKRKSKKKKQQTGTLHDDGAQNLQREVNDSKASVDEIDLALLSLRDRKSRSNAYSGGPLGPGNDLLRLYPLLATDTKYLNALYEMKRLFGNVVLDGENEDAALPHQGRRRGRGRQGLDLGGALAARNSPVSRGQGLAGLALRRNVFMVGKESWPKATSGGMGMEVVEKADDMTIEYRFVHNSMYQDVQRQFLVCTESMDPQRMIQLLQFNRKIYECFKIILQLTIKSAYHITTLLIVSEIAEHQGDHSVSGELLERALFSFGRSVHSSFHNALAEGKARLDFRRPENREFWLVAWRYIGNLGQRGTWRTAYEWAKLLLSLDPEEDPYCIRLILDQIALRSGQAQSFCELVDASKVLFSWARDCPNIIISSALAEYKLKRPEGCRRTLSSAVQRFPWVFLRLFQELNIGHTPKAIWGRVPQNAHQKLETEAYVARAKDIWNTPEAISLLVEVVESTEVDPDAQRGADHPISLNEARHVLLSGTPSLISLLPREFTTARSSSYDILPPEDSIFSYHADTVNDAIDLDDEDQVRSDTLPALVEGSTQDSDQQADERRELRGLEAFFSRFIPWLGRARPTSGSNNTDLEEQTLEDIQESLATSGLPAEVTTDRLQRLVELQTRFNAEGDNEMLSHEIIEAMQEDFNSSSADDTNFRSSGAGHRSTSPRQGHSPTSPHLPLSETATSSNAAEPYDDERNQRWLAGQGMIRLRDFIAEHGSDEKDFQRDSSLDITPVTEYAQRVTLLQRRTTRNFILDYVLQQGTSGDVRELILRVIEHLEN